MTSFTVAVDCLGGGTSHKHVIVIQPAPGRVYGSGPPSTVRLQYTCPVASEALIVTFKPPVGAARPFEVVEVT